MEEMDTMDDIYDVNDDDTETISEGNSTIGANKRNVCYHCRICDNKYLLANSLSRHMYDTHVNLAELRCINCDQKFANTAVLRRHIARYRDTIELSGREMYSFVNQREIKRNSKEIRFLCTICKMEYSHAPSFSRHIYNIHIDILNMQCLNCMERFASKHELKTHMFRYRETIQNTMAKDVSTANSDDDSEWIGSKIEPVPSTTMNFMCTVCLNTYNHATSFSRHLYDIHADLDHLMCLNCNEQFESLKCLRTHMIGYRKTIESAAVDNVANELHESETTEQALPLAEVSLTEGQQLLPTKTNNILRMEGSSGSILI